MGKFWNIEDLCGYEDSRVDPGAIDSEISQLRDAREDYEAQGVLLPEEQAEKLAMLLAFRREVESLTEHDFDDAVMVPDQMFELFTKSRADADYGLNDENGPYYFINWEGWMDNRKKHQFKRVILNGDDIWVQVGQ